MSPGEDFERITEILLRLLRFSGFKQNLPVNIGTDCPGLKVPRFLKSRHGLVQTIPCLPGFFQGKMSDGHLRKPYGCLVRPARQCIDTVCPAGIFEALPVFAHSVVDFCCHATADCQFQGVFFLFAKPDCLKYVLFSLCGLTGCQAYSCQGVERV